MILNSPYITGSITVTGNTTIQGSLIVTGSLSGTASLASNSNLLQGTGSVGFATTASLLQVSSSQQQISASLLTLTASYTALSSSYTALSGSYNMFSGSASTRITVDSASLQQVSSSQQQISASYIALSASYTTFSGSASTRVTKIENNYATTGSNSFRADQSITGSLVVSSTITAQTLVVQTVTSSIVYSSGSNVFGNQLTDRQTFTGSVNITGSITLTGGSVGIGVSPVLKLDVQGNAADTGTISGVTVEQVTLFRPSNGVGGIRTGFNTTTGDAYLWSAQSGASLNFGVRSAPNNTAYLSIASTGTATFSNHLISNSPGGGVNAATFYDRTGAVGAAVDQYGTLAAYSGILNSNGVYGAGSSGTALVFNAGAVEQFRISATNMTVVGNVTAGAKFETSFSNTNTSFDNNSYVRLVNTGTSTLNQRVDLILRWADGTYNGTGGISMVRESATARSGKLVLQPIGSDGNNLEALTLASTGAATFSSTVTLVNDLTINAALTPIVYLNTTSTNKASGFVTQESGTSKWAIGSNFGSGDGTFNLYNYGAAARYLTIATTGAATFSSSVTVTGNNSLVFQGTGATTGYQYGAFVNTGGNVLWGVAGSNGSFWNSGNAGAYFSTIGTTTATNFVIATNNTGVLTVTSGGNVLIGTTTDAGYKLDVIGSVRCRSPFRISNESTYGISITAAGGSSGNTILADGSQGLVLGGNATAALTFSSNSTTATFAGAVSKASGTFKIDHPLDALSETHQLVHSFIEGPRVDLIYRGVVKLINGSAIINIDEDAGMTEGTFEALNRETQFFITNQSGWNNIKGSLQGNILTIEAEDTNSTDTIAWMVVGERQDEHIKNTDWTDENGKPILEPLKIT